MHHDHQPCSSPDAPARGSGHWVAFLTMGFVIVGLAGVFAVYAAQLPLLRGMAHDKAIVAVAIAPPSESDALRQVLGRDYDRLMAAPGPLPARIAAARNASRDEFLKQAADIRQRLIIVLVVVTLASALFGAMLLSVVRISR